MKRTVEAAIRERYEELSIFPSKKSLLQERRNIDEGGTVGVRLSKSYSSKTTYEFI